MKVQEAIAIFKELLDVPEQMLIKYSSVTTDEQKTALIRVRKAEDMAIKSLEMQEKLKQWIEGYKRQEFNRLSRVLKYRILKENDTDERGKRQMKHKPYSCDMKQKEGE